MRRIKAVIFDLDGTIANTLPLCISAFRQAIEPLIKRPVSDGEIIATFGPSEEGTIKALAPAHYDKGVADYLRYYESSHHMCSTPFERISSLLGFLKEKGVHLSLVTGKGRYSTGISLKQFQLEEMFEFIETGSPLGPRKPEAIQLILEKLENVSKDEVIYVGDAPSDILSSREAGVASVAAAWAETSEPAKLLALQPDELFYSIEEFFNWLKVKI
ncbi:HAD family hydrolase [Algoriphagus resistens]|uniref:HAD family hydrolase n=1 Tax=Algoriphagus resistens TaxID=1750590 RepID=UPI000716C5A9|nr:HAD family hydrolase [Algoriphagus resistens]